MYALYYLTYSQSSDVSILVEVQIFFSSNFYSKFGWSIYNHN